MTEQHSTPNPPRHPQLADDEIDLRELFRILWQGKWIIIAVSFVFTVGSVLYAISLPNIYQAEAKLAPTKESQGGGMGNLGQLGGLASLAGVSLPRGQVDNARIAQEILRSRAFLADFAERRNIAPDLIAIEGWDSTTGKVRYDSSIFNSNTQEWIREVTPPRQKTPSSWEVVDELRKVLRVSDDPNTGIVTLAIEHQSPFVAKQWVDWLLRDINDEMRRRDIEEAKNSIAYIEREIEHAKLTTTLEVYSSLLEQQTQTIMLANVRPEYIFRIIDPPVVPEEHSKPARTIIVLIGIALGVLFSLALIFLANLFGFLHKLS
ncbi:MAG: LPS O-antigen length regulator [Idiomarina sp.]|nr:LPS O-antigen length regulator [Idiomarina sp.]